MKIKEFQGFIYIPNYMESTMEFGFFFMKNPLHMFKPYF